MRDIAPRLCVPGGVVLSECSWRRQRADAEFAVQLKDKDLETCAIRGFVAYGKTRAVLFI